jgi:hypothetical protein
MSYDRSIIKSLSDSPLFFPFFSPLAPTGKISKQPAELWLLAALTSSGIEYSACVLTLAISDNMSPSHRDTLGTSLLVLGSACAGAALTLAAQRLWKQKSDPEKDYQVAHGLVWDAIMKQSKEQILSFLEQSSSSAAAKEEISSAALFLIEQSSTSSTPKQQSDGSFNWLSDCTDYWQDIPADIQQAAKDLGYTQALWDNSLQPVESNEWWQDLSASQRNAAEKLGYHQTTWDQQPGQSPIDDDNDSGRLAKNQKTDETASVESNHKSKDVDEKAKKGEFMANSLSNKKEDTQKEAEDEQAFTKFLSDKKEDSEETVEEDEFISNFLSDKKEDSQELTASDEEEDEFISNFL